MIQVIEWVTKAWSMVSPERIFRSWKKTRLLPMNPDQDWASSKTRDVAKGIFRNFNKQLLYFDETRSIKQLEKIMSQLNVVIPWELEELVGLVNERGKITLSYASIEEIIGSCLLESVEDEGQTDDEENRDIDSDNGEAELNESGASRWSISENDLKDASNILFNKAISSDADTGNAMMKVDSTTMRANYDPKAPLDSSNAFNQDANGVTTNNPHAPSFPFETLGNEKHKLDPLESWNRKRQTPLVVPTHSQHHSNIDPLFENGLINSPNINLYDNQNEQQQPSQAQAFTSSSQVDNDIVQSILKLTNYSSLNSINLSQSTIDDLNYNLKIIQSRSGQN